MTPLQKKMEKLNHRIKEICRAHLGRENYSNPIINRTAIKILISEIVDLEQRIEKLEKRFTNVQCNKGPKRRLYSS